VDAYYRFKKSRYSSKMVKQCDNSSDDEEEWDSDMSEPEAPLCNRLFLEVPLVWFARYTVSDHSTDLRTLANAIDDHDWIEAFQTFVRLLRLNAFTFTIECHL